MRRFAEIDSTNSYLLGEARSGAAEGLVAVADVQRAGRGRLDRTWDSPPGASLLASILLRPSLAVDRTHLAVAAVALAAADACVEVAGIRPGLKWPNDLVVGPGDRKLGGILSEAHLPPAVIVGLGLNVDWPVGTLPAGAAELGPVDRHELLAALLRHLDALYGDWSRVSMDYRAACVTVGRQVRVELSGETFTGTAVAISDAGHLVVSPTTAAGAGPQALRIVTAGDVVHLRPHVPDSGVDVADDYGGEGGGRGLGEGTRR